MNTNVVAVVVTFNRKELLCECLDALLAQSHPLYKIVLVNNASTDGTEELLRRKGYLDKSQIDYVLQPKNIGGAGGFYEGIKRGRDKYSCDWVWVMDDDTIPTSTALAEFLNGADELRKITPGIKIGFMSGVTYDESGNGNNIQAVSSGIKNPWWTYLKFGIATLKNASFVSLLVPMDVVCKCGLPCRDFFIWGDDVEYTSRIVKYYGNGYLCGRASILHKQKETPDIIHSKNMARIAMRRFGVRNNFIISLYYRGVIKSLKYAVASMLIAIKCIPTKNGFYKVWIMIGGLVDGIVQYRKFRKVIENQISNC